MATTGFVIYCPEFCLYRYSAKDPANPAADVDYKFDLKELEDAIVSYLAADQKVQAETMTNMTGLARLHPHKVVRFDIATKSVTVVEPSEHFKEMYEIRALYDETKPAQEG